MLLAVSTQKAPNPLWDIWASKPQVGLNDAIIFTIRGQNVAPDTLIEYTIYEEEYPPRTGGGTPLAKKEEGSIRLQNGTASVGFRTLDVKSAYPDRRVRIVLHSGATGTLSVPIVGPVIIDTLTFSTKLGDYTFKSGSRTLSTRIPVVFDISQSSMKLKEFNSSGQIQTSFDKIARILDDVWDNRNQPYPYVSFDIWAYIPEIYSDPNKYLVEVVLSDNTFYISEHITNAQYGGVFGDNMTAQDRANTHWVRFKASKTKLDDNGSYVTSIITINVYKK